MFCGRRSQTAADGRNMKRTISRVLLDSWPTPISWLGGFSVVLYNR